jgi:hypothetical protein
MARAKQAHDDVIGAEDRRGQSKNRSQKRPNTLRLFPHVSFIGKREMRHTMMLVALVGLTGCAVEPPASPMEKYARLAAAARVSAENCGGYVGGYASAQQLRDDANMNVAKARQLGATDAVLAKARSDVLNAFNTALVFTTPQDACSQLISELAWHSG